LDFQVALSWEISDDCRPTVDYLPILFRDLMSFKSKTSMLATDVLFELDVQRRADDGDQRYVILPTEAKLVQEEFEAALLNPTPLAVILFYMNSLNKNSYFLANFAKFFLSDCLATTATNKLQRNDSYLAIRLRSGGGG
jgi:hypothetical protein